MGKLLSMALWARQTDTPAAQGLILLLASILFHPPFSSSSSILLFLPRPPSPPPPHRLATMLPHPGFVSHSPSPYVCVCVFPFFMTSNVAPTFSPIFWHVSRKLAIKHRWASVTNCDLTNLVIVSCYCFLKLTIRLMLNHFSSSL